MSVLNGKWHVLNEHFVPSDSVGIRQNPHLAVRGRIESLDSPWLESVGHRFLQACDWSIEVMEPYYRPKASLYVGVSLRFVLGKCIMELLS